MKRLFDILVSFSILLPMLPIMIILAVLIKVETKGPVIFKQERIGLHGKRFFVYKFRSMNVDAAKQGPYYTTSGDSRITRVGRFVRKTSMDELPQLFNVLKGDMSLVGPRPDVPAQSSNYTDSQWEKRNSVLPGITGLAQALQRSAAGKKKRTELDLEYVDKASISFDIWIMLMTVKQLLFSSGKN